MIKPAALSFSLFLSFIILQTAEGTRKCVWVRGALLCKKDPSKQLNTEVRVYDRDGFSLFKLFDPDDLMGITFTDHDGTFQLDGCGDDFNWFPGLQNLPDPYIRIFHYCNNPKGEALELPEFNTFVPETYDIGLIELDRSHNHTNKYGDSKQSGKKNKILQKENPLVIPLPDDSDAGQFSPKFSLNARKKDKYDFTKIGERDDDLVSLGGDHEEARSNASNKTNVASEHTTPADYDLRATTGNNNSNNVILSAISNSSSESLEKGRPDSHTQH